MIASAAVVAALITSGGCGPGGTYLVGPGTGAAGGRMDTTGSGGGLGGGAGFGGVPGSGGVIAETGGAPGTGGEAAGGRSASGGNSGGGASGTGTGGGGGRGSAGAPGSGGAGTGGATGGAGGAARGSVGSGGMALGGRMGSGGATPTGGGPGSGGAGGRGGAVGSGGSGSGGMGGGPSGTGGSNRRVLSVDFVGAQVTSFGGAGGKTVTPMPMALTEVAGFKPAANWNSAAGAASSGSGLTPLLLDNGSTAGSASVTWNAPTTATSPGVYSVGLADEPGDSRMMNGYLDPAGGSPPAATITVTGLPSPFTTTGYDVYVYFLAALGDAQMRSHKFTLTTPSPGNYNMSVTVSQTGPSPMTFSGYSLATATTGNYVVFKNVTGSQFTLTSTAVMTTTMALRAPVNGFQIVWPPGS